MSALLRLAQRQGRLLLVLGLIGGFALPGLAAAMAPWLPAMVAALVVLSALRIGARAALGTLRDARAALGAVLTLQLALPLCVASALSALGLAAHPMGVAAILAVSAPSISGGPTFTAMIGHPPERAMRLLILGTLLLPVTVLPVFWFSAAFADPSAVIWAAARLAVVLVGAVGLGLALRRLLFAAPSQGTIQSIDGASALLLAVIVIGLMSAVGPALRSDPASLLPWLALVFAVNFGLQIAAHVAGASPGTAIVAGNRNVALFLVALPAEVLAPLLLFIGCYQIPMYLTPLIMKPLYART